METSEDEGKLSFNTRQTPEILTSFDIRVPIVDTPHLAWTYYNHDDQNRRQ